MPLDTLPGKLIVPTRADEQARYRRDYELRKRTGGGDPVDTGPATEVWIQASTLADLTSQIYADARIIANGVTRATATGEALREWAIRAGTDFEPAKGASGEVIISATAGGAALVAGDEIKIAGIRYGVITSGTYYSGSRVPIAGTDAGPGTNQEAGTVGQWSSPRPGLFPTATVAMQADGTGLTGGSNAESDDELRQRLDDLAANPPASGNDAQYRALAREVPGLGVEQPFTYDAIKGPGTIGLVFTIRPAKPGGNRIPNGAQIAQMAPALVGSMPGNDGLLVGTLSANPINVALRVTWARGVPGWRDQSPWPTYQYPAMTQVKAGTTPTATAFTLTGCASTPPVGNTLAFFDKPAGVFRAKKILTVTSLGSGDFAIACDVVSGSSDTSYAPFVGQPVCPWSDSLTTIAGPVLSYFDGLGPGEQVAAPIFDPGLRERRAPESPASWPSTVTNRVIAQLFPLPAVGDVTLEVPAVPYVTPVGSPGVLSYLTTLSALVAFPQ